MPSSPTPSAAPVAPQQIPRIQLLLWAVIVVASGLAVLDVASDMRRPHYPVTGSVTLDGDIPRGAEVVFHPVDPRGWTYVSPRGVVRSDGSFQVKSLGKWGAIPGEYAVTVAWTPVVFDGDALVHGANRIALDYSRPDTTPLRAVVSEGVNHLEPYEVSCRCSSDATTRVKLASISL